MLPTTAGRPDPHDAAGERPVNDFLFAVGLVVVLFTGASVLFTIVLPREPRGFERLSSFANRLVRMVFIAVSRLARTYEGKDALLAPTAPVALVAQLAIWAASSSSASR